MKKKLKKSSNVSYKENNAFEPGWRPYSRKELLDYDYIHKLNKEEKKWLAKFTREWVDASFEENNMQEKRELYRMNNKRNVDYYAKHRVYLQKEHEKAETIEDTLISKLDFDLKFKKKD